MESPNNQNGKKAISKLETDDYDLVFMDIQMPELDGYQTTKIIRSRDSNVRNHDILIVAMTAHAMHGDREKCLSAGMNDYIPKPIQDKDIDNLMNKYFSNRKTRQKTVNKTTDKMIFNKNTVIETVGEEYLDISSDYDMSLEGLEDEDLYKQNLNTFFEIEEFREKGAKELKGIKRIVEKLKKKLYPAQLLELEKIENDYEDEKASLAEYYKYLNAVAKKINQNTTGLVNFASFIKVVESEAQINFPSVE